MLRVVFIIRTATCLCVPRDTEAINKGGSIVFAVATTGDVYSFGSISGRKENFTAGNASGYLACVCNRQ